MKNSNNCVALNPLWGALGTLVEALRALLEPSIKKKVGEEQEDEEEEEEE